jgi:hypothetical protein
MPIADCRLPIALSSDDWRSEGRLKIAGGLSALINHIGKQPALGKQSTLGNRTCNRPSAIGLRQ